MAGIPFIVRPSSRTSASAGKHRPSAFTSPSRSVAEDAATGRGRTRDLAVPPCSRSGSAPSIRASARRRQVGLAPGPPYRRGMGLPPHRTPGGSFRNPWPDSAPHGLRDVLRWVRERRTRARIETPKRGSFPTATPEISYPRGDDNGLSATWIGHSTVLLQLGGRNVLTHQIG